MSSPGSACFAVLDVGDGLFGLRKRSATLDGAVPLRAAQACVPLLEGNALGWQVVLNRPLRLRRRLGGFALHEEGSAAAAQLGLGRLLAHGLVEPGGRWQRALLHGPLWSERSLVGHRADRLWLWTGLLLKPDPGVWLRVMSAANRRHTGLEVAEVVVADDDTFVPLVLELTLAKSPPRELELHGELACVVPFAPGVTFTSTRIEDEPAVGQAHASFYDASYFAQKKKGTTRRYRRQINTQAGAPASSAGAGGQRRQIDTQADVSASAMGAGCPHAGALAAAPAAATEGAVPQQAACQVIAAGPGTFVIQSSPRFASAREPEPAPRPTERRRAEVVEFYNLLPFTCFYDGYTLRLKYSLGELQDQAQKLWQRWRALYGEAFVDAHQGALWYLSKYFTMHPPGEPYFFVKPWAFVRTPPGWSCLVEGAHGDGYDVLRGVVATDQFFATPGVFAVHQLNRELTVAADAPILRALPLPRCLLHAGYRVAQLGKT